MMATSKSSRGVWRYLFAALALVLLVRYVGLDRLSQTLAATHPGWVALFVLAFATMTLLWGVQVWIALRLLGHAPALRTTLAACANSWSLGILTPARSGDLSLAYFIGPQTPRPVALALVVTDKIFSLLFLTLAAGVAALWLSLGFNLALASGLLSIAVVAGILTVKSRWLVPAFLRWSRRFLGSRPAEFWNTLVAMLEHRRYLAFMWAAITIRWLLLCAINLLLFRAVGHVPRFLFVVAATAVGRIIALIPVSIGGIGLKEPIQIGIYGADGIPPEALIAVSLLGMASGLLLAAALPLLFPWSQPSEGATR